MECVVEPRLQLRKVRILVARRDVRKGPLSTPRHAMRRVGVPERSATKPDDNQAVARRSGAISNGPQVGVGRHGTLRMND